MVIKLRADKVMFYQPIPLPTFIAFEPINLCNAKCFCCPYTTLSEDKSYHGKRMTKEQLTMLFDDYGSLIQKYGVEDWTCGVNPWRYSDPLVQPDLEHIMSLCDKYKIKVGITTNGISFGKKQCEIIQKYLHLLGSIHMSVIGHTAEELWDYMKIKKDKTLQSLRFVKENYPEISKKIKVGIKHKNQSIAVPPEVYEEYQEVNLGKVRPKNQWLENRIGDGDGDWTAPFNWKVNEQNFVTGCAMGGGRILRQMEILVDGQAVLCCDDADGKTNFGNVFKDGIEKVWRELSKFHNLIFDKKYSDQKHSMICNTCSRAKNNKQWNEGYEHRLNSRQQTAVNKIKVM